MRCNDSCSAFFCAIVLLFGCYKGEIKNRYDFNIENDKAIITEVFAEPDCTNAVEIIPIKNKKHGFVAVSKKPFVCFLIKRLAGNNYTKILQDDKVLWLITYFQL